MSENAKKSPPRRGKKHGLFQKLVQHLPYPVVEFLDDALDLYDKKRGLTPREKRIMAAFGVLLGVAVLTNPSEDSYKKHLNRNIAERLRTGDIKERHFNKILYGKVMADAENSVDRTNLIVLSLYSTSVSLYSDGTPDLETSSIGFLGNFLQTGLEISSPLEESLRPPRANGNAK